MRYGNWAESGLWSAALLLAVWNALTWRDATAVTPPPEAIAPASAGEPQSLTPADLAVAARTAIERNPFRLDRRPPDVEMGMHTPAAEFIEHDYHTTVQPPPLVLRGTLGGPPWEALIDGVPDRQASVLVRSGELVGELRILRVVRDTVVVQFADTTWHLTLPHTSQ